MFVAAMFLVAPSVSAVTISPPTFNYNLNPGDTVKDVLKVYNELPETVTVYPTLQNFTAGKEENGAPLFYDAEQDPYGTALAPWIKLNSAEPVRLAPGERANIEFSLTIPSNAQPGGHYGALLLAATPPAASNTSPEVGIGSQTGVLLLVNVSGDVRESGNVEEFGFTQRRSYYNYLPVDFFLRFANTGNTHLRPAGNVFITNMLGSQVASIDVNRDFRNVLPRSIRRFDFGWKKADLSEGTSELVKEWRNFGFGTYRATMVLNYGSKNQTVTKALEFSVWPWRVMLISVLCLALLVLVIAVLLRNYNRMVIRKYEQMKAAEGGAGQPPMRK